jgi:Calcineurin-like phosphoesterase
MSSPQTWVVFGDTQIPFQHKPVLSLVLHVIDALRPHGVLMNGDIVDAYSASDYVKRPMTKADLLMEQQQAGQLMQALRDVPQKVWIGGNHCDRINRLVAKHAPALGVLPELAFDRLFHLADYGFQWLEYGQYYKLGKLLVSHGSIVRRASGASAQAHLLKYGCSVLVNHTHRGGVFYRTDTTGTHVAFENFCLCRVDPQYAHQPVDWQWGCSIVKVEPKSGLFHVTQVPILPGMKCWYGEQLFQLSRQPRK